MMCILPQQMLLLVCLCFCLAAGQAPDGSRLFLKKGKHSCSLHSGERYVRDLSLLSFNLGVCFCLENSPGGDVYRSIMSPSELFFFLFFSNLPSEYTRQL